MKMTIRVFAMGLVLAGAVAASSAPKTAPVLGPKVLAASYPVPKCIPTDGETCGFRQ